MEVPFNSKHTKIELYFIPPSPEESDVSLQIYIFDSQKGGNARVESKDYIDYLGVLLDIFPVNSVSILSAIN